MGSACPNRRLRRATRAWGPPRLLCGVLVLSGVHAPACDFPRPQACALACGPAGECPSAFECQPETLLCAPRGQVEPCTSTLVLPGGDGEAPPDAGQAPPDGPPPDEPSDAGEEPGPGRPPPSLSIESSLASPACTGAELELELAANGGREPYDWRLLQAPAGVRLSATSGSRVALRGAPEVAGQVLVEIVDAAGRRVVSEEIVVHQRPSIDTSALPALCAGAGYQAPLEGSGDVDTRIWSARLAGGDTLSLDALGLEVVGSSLRALSIPEDVEPQRLRLQLGLSDGWCDAEDVNLEVELATLDAEACPSIAIAGRASGHLPPPCRGNRYTELASVEGGVPPFTWTELAAPPGLYFDVDSGVLDGVASDDGELALALTDGGGRTVEAVYDVSVRDRCWLAYVAGGIAPARLALVDPHLLDGQPENARRQFPESGPAAVVDYRFSPDGRFIAYRSGAAADALGLELVRVVDGATTPVALPDPAAEYAWSMDSSLLFVVTGAAERMLRAIDVSAVPDDGDDLAGVRLLGARAIPAPSGPLVAFGERQLAFSSSEAAAPQRLRLVTTGVQGSAVARPITREELDFSTGSRIEGARAGALVLDPETAVTSFFAGAGGAPVAHADALASSSSPLVARASSGNLALFDDANASVPRFQAPGCADLLARASDSERFACAGDRPGLAFFELGPSGLGVLGRVEPGTSDRSGSRRVFSPSGRWFASPETEGLSVWSLEPGGPRRAALLPRASLGGAASTISFSPDESQLVFGSANRLQMLELGGADASLIELDSSALLDEGCSERATDGTEHWCGSDSGSTVLRWAASSDAVAFRSALGTLVVLDTSAARDGKIRRTAPDADCEEACVSSTSARFQP